MLYPVHVITRKSLGEMTRKLSVTESHSPAQFLGTVSRRNPSGEISACGVARVVCHMLVHKPPEPFDRVQVRAIRRNEMQLNPPTGLSQPLLHQPSMVITSIVEKDVNERQHRIERLNSL